MSRALPKDSSSLLSVGLQERVVIVLNCFKLWSSLAVPAKHGTVGLSASSSGYMPHSNEVPMFEHAASGKCCLPAIVLTFLIRFVS